MERSESNAGEEPLTDVLAPHRSRTSSLRSLELEEIKGSSITEDVVGFDEIDGGSYDGSSSTGSLAVPSVDSNIGRLEEPLDPLLESPSGGNAGAKSPRQETSVEFEIVELSMPRKGVPMAILQFMALLIKNLHVQKRSMFMNCFMLFLPGLSILAIIALQLLIRAYVPPVFEIEEERFPVPDLIYNDYTKEEIPFADSTDLHSKFDSWIRSGFEVFGTLGDGFLGRHDLEAYLYMMWNKLRDIGPISSAVWLSELNFSSSWSFAIYYNSSDVKGFDTVDLDIVPVMYNRMSSGYLYGRFAYECSKNSSLPVCSVSPPGNFDKQASIFLGKKDFPREYQEIEVDVLAYLQIFFFAIMFHFLCPVIVASVVHEKEYRLIENMRMMGLKILPYYLVHYVFYFSMHILMVAVLLAFGWLFSLRIFTQVDIVHTLFFWLIWGHALVGLAIFFSAFFGRSRLSFLVVFVVVFLFSTVAYVVSLAVERAALWVRLILDLMPTFAFTHGIMLLSMQTALGQPGYAIEDFEGPKLDNLEGMILFLFVDGLLYLVLGLYLQEVLPKRHGLRRNVLFPLFSVFEMIFGNKRKLKKIPVAQFYTRTGSELERPADVEAERNRLMHLHEDSEALKREEVQIHALRKKYSGSSRFALQEVTFGIQSGECLGLLGPNGAGKTTLINILSGLFSATSGTCIVGGGDIRRNMDGVRQAMGVCSQDNVLWPDLTAAETIAFYGRLHGVRGKELSRSTKSLLDKLDLAHRRYRKLTVKKFSGGMKRRLSVAVAIVGNPQVVYLDEPTTGLDPDAKRLVWDVIVETAKTKAVLLTTHSMEEADAVCDRIAILSAGQLKCIGEKTELKTRFGKEYRLSFRLRPGNESVESIETVIDTISPLFQGRMELLDRLGGNFEFEVPREVVDLALVFEQMEEFAETLPIESWSLSATTLDEIFVRMTQEAEQDEKEQ